MSNRSPTDRSVLDALLARIRPVDERARLAAVERHNRLTKPPGSLGRLEAVGIRLAAVQGSERPTLTRPGVAVFAADHGVAAAGVSAYPSAVTAQMVRNFLAGGAAIAVLAGRLGADLLVVDVGVDGPFDDHPALLRRKVRAGSANFLKGPAMEEAEALEALRVGSEAAERLAARGADLLIGGEMGIANTTSAAAITAAATGLPVAEVTGRGSGVDGRTLERKLAVIEAALALHRPDPAQPLALLTALGGLEIAALVGFYLEGAARRLPLMLDGFICGAAALLAVALSPPVRDYLFAGHRGAEPGHAHQLARLGLDPLLELELRLGEASGAALAAPLLIGAAAVLAEMASFEEAGVEPPPRRQAE